MERKTYFFALALGALLAGGCDNLGTCKGDTQGRNPVVLPDGTVMYAGQAIIVQSCAPGGVCHSVTAEGSARDGAPKTLNFDIRPAKSTGVGSDGKAIVDATELARLRFYQQKVFSNRNDIWKQVVRGLMPPSGVGEPFRTADNGTYVSVSGTSCTRGNAVGAITDSAAQNELRNWLACNSPVVETNEAKLAAPVPGTVGDQYPLCGGGQPGGATFDNVYTTVIQPACIACHIPGGQSPVPDFSTEQKAYDALLGLNGANNIPICATNMSPYVTPGDVSKSYIIPKIGGGGTFCGAQMPVGVQLPQSSIDLFKAWIEAGAPAPGVSGGGDAGLSGGDAGI